MSPGAPTISFSGNLLDNYAGNQVSITDNTTTPPITSNPCTLSYIGMSPIPTQVTEILGASNVTPGQEAMLALIEKHNMVPFEHMNQLYFIRSEQAEVLEGIRGNIQLLTVKHGNVTELVTSAETVHGLEKLAHLEWLGVDNVRELDVSGLLQISRLVARSATTILIPAKNELQFLAAPQLTTGIPLDTLPDETKLYMQIPEAWTNITDIIVRGEWIFLFKGKYEYKGGTVQEIPTE